MRWEMIYSRVDQFLIIDGPADTEEWRPIGLLETMLDLLDKLSVITGTDVEYADD